jgi:hypothetical protein
MIAGMAGGVAVLAGLVDGRNADVHAFIGSSVTLPCLAASFVMKRSAHQRGPRHA